MRAGESFEEFVAAVSPRLRKVTPNARVLSATVLLDRRSARDKSLAVTDTWGLLVGRTVDLAFSR